MNRVYLDHNATTPLRPEARAAMVEAMDVVGNPSSVHAEGRAAKMLVERARAQVAELVGCDVSEVVFTSGATEAAALVAGLEEFFVPSPVEHDCLLAHQRLPEDGSADSAFRVEADGRVFLDHPEGWDHWHGYEYMYALQRANSETGVLQTFKLFRPGELVCDIVQSVFREMHTPLESADYHLVSAHKMGGPKGVGALIVADRARHEFEKNTPMKGGGQEMGRRSGTENVIGIAGFGAAAEAAKRDVDAGKWAEVEKLRNILEKALEAPEKETIFVGNEAPRLPNTSCILTPGWKGETQVMQMDLAGFAISAGSACSSGKVKASRVLRAMGYDETDAACAIRVSLGLETTEDEVLAFADAWTKARDKHFARLAAQ